VRGEQVSLGPGERRGGKLGPSERREGYARSW
jgi:hypothetical protein